MTFVNRFGNYRASDGALARFLAAKEVKSYDALLKLLEGAKLIRNTKRI